MRGGAQTPFITREKFRLQWEVFVFGFFTITGWFESHYTRRFHWTFSGLVHIYSLAYNHKMAYFDPPKCSSKVDNRNVCQSSRRRVEAQSNAEFAKIRETIHNWISAGIADTCQTAIWILVCCWAMFSAFRPRKAIVERWNRLSLKGEGVRFIFLLTDGWNLNVWQMVHLNMRVCRERRFVYVPTNFRWLYIIFIGCALNSNKNGVSIWCFNIGVIKMLG